MYRSQVLYARALKDTRTAFPICVPSYNRPAASLLQRLKQYKELKVILFIRNTLEQKRLYKGYREHFRIVLLDNVTELGETRKAIVDWCIKNKLAHIFMLDDDIHSLDYLYPHETKNGTMCMRSSRPNDLEAYNKKYLNRINPDVFKMWRILIEESDKKLTLSAPNYRPDSWHMKNVNLDTVYNKGVCSQCVHINIKNLYKHNLNYASTAECGVEDYALQFKVMSKGLYTCNFTDFMYDCPTINSIPGGCENANGISDVKQRYAMYLEQFINNVSGANHAGIKIKTARSGVQSIKFVWNYWQIK